MRQSFRLAICTLLVAMPLTGCAAMPADADAPDLEGTAWVLAELSGRAQLPGGRITLRFEGGRASGSDGCNRYSLPYAASGGRLELTGPGIATPMACAPDVTDQASAYMAGLAAARSYRIVRGQLELCDEAGDALIRLSPQPQELAGTAWRVSGYNNGRQAVVGVLGGTSLSVHFGADGRVSGSAGCNDFTAAYTARGTAISIGPVAATRKLCGSPERIMEQEQQFLRALETANTTRREGERLELRTATGALAVSLVEAAS